MNLEQLKDKHVREFDIECAERSLEESSADDRVLFYLTDLDNISNVIMKFELTRWIPLLVAGIVAYYLSLHVFEDGFLHDVASYVMGMCVLGFAFLSHIINSNKASNAGHKALVATMFAVRDRIKRR